MREGSIIAEGAADYFFGRPYEQNPYNPTYYESWKEWADGWDWARWYDEARGDEERARWAAAATIEAP